MSRAPDGIYTLPNGTLVQQGDTIQPSQHNTPFQDVANALSDSLSRSGRGGMQTALAMGGNKITGVAPGTNPTDVATVSQLAGSGGAVPTGTVVDFAGPTAPSGWLVCGGQSLSRTTYADLFAVIGTTYGAADGASFSLPDLRGRVSAGRDFAVSGSLANRLTTPDSQALGANGGAQTVQLTEAQMPAHTHSGTADSAGNHSHTISVGTERLVQLSPNGAVVASASPGTTSSNGLHSHNVTVGSAGSNQAHNNVQPTIVLNKIIKV